MTFQITEGDIQKLKKAGYSDKQIQIAITEMEEEEMNREYEEAQKQNYGRDAQSSMHQYNPTDNLVKWQLELNDILEKAEHILREDIPVIRRGNVEWERNPNPDSRIFNDYAVHEIMRILTLYINRNTILSDYEPDDIHIKVLDFGKEVNNLIYMKYEDFGLTTLSKRKNYPILLREIVDLVDSTYRRALYGAEKESLRTAREIHQQEQVTPNINVMTGQSNRERGVLNPFRYIAGKYK